MTHPEELLAPYVDGTASAEERAVVDTHVTSCARCRAEIVAAGAARAELRRLPVVDAPAGLAPDLDAPASGRAPVGAPVWYRWAGGAAVAAVIVLLLAMILPHIGGSPSDTGAARASGGPQALTKDSGIGIEAQTQDYSGPALTQLLQAQALATAQAPNAAATAVSSPEVSSATVDPQVTHARACIEQAFTKVPGTLIRLISARFGGAPAYIGIYEQGPRGQPADTIVGRVAAVATCTPLTLAQARLGA